MVSIMDAVFMPIAALFVIFFIIPALILAPQKSADFAEVTSKGVMEVAVPSMMMTYVNTVDDKNKKNYKDISYRLSGKPSNTGVDKSALYDHPTELAFLKLRYRGGGNNFNHGIVGGKDVKRQDIYYRMALPLKGGEIGNISVKYEVY